MRTRRASYPSASDGITFLIRPGPLKRRRLSQISEGELSASPAGSSVLELLHDELLVSIMAKLSSSASSPMDLISVMLTCKRLCAAATHPLVLANASMAALAVKARSWSDDADRFLQECVKSGSAEAAYTLGMIKFYCFREHESGAALMAQAALKPHARALHSLAVIQFNGSGGSRKDKNLKNGATLCAKAAAQGHIDAIRELGHCLQDGYGVPKSVSEGRRLLLEANAREAAAAVAASPQVFAGKAASAVAASPRSFVETALTLAHHQHYHAQHRSVVSKVDASTQGGASSLWQVDSFWRLLHGSGCSLLSDFGCNVPPPQLHIANRFMVDWFAMNPPEAGLRLCSHAGCGRPETRRHEFRRCSSCGTVNYCSRSCQALDWKIRHKYECYPFEDREDEGDEVEDDDERNQDHNQDS
ncbi:hypothetical protein KP509_25G024100 [Ceratopteris richardii]|uniref:MYND-type domain-containing protein n=1 Tax=Ceratopteris richardii TaxID=49495 RepID=A0A8T2RR79_CERRI|nr:hypothetical protein KP509_25G024100 [Ceratopteris richardii]